MINRRKTAAQISHQVGAALDVPREQLITDLVIDLSDVAWISSVGLNELIGLQARARTSGVHLRLRSPTETVREVLRITRLERIFEFEGELQLDPVLASGVDHQPAGGGASQPTAAV